MPQTQRKANQQTRLDQASMGTALVAAAEAGSPRLLEILLAEKPSDEQLIAAARTCIQRERVDFLQLVLRAGADLTSFPAFHHLAHLAGPIKSYKSANAILITLNEAGAAIPAKTRRPGSSRKSKQIPFAELLREHGYLAALSLLNAMMEAQALSTEVPAPAARCRSIAL